MAGAKASVELAPDTFRQLVTRGDAFVDKSLFIQEVIESGYKAILITRPRRWGKSLALDMLRAFFSIETDDKGTKLAVNPSRVLFEGGIFNTDFESKKLSSLKIAHKYPKYMLRQGYYPVIFVTFKDTNGDSYASVVEKIKLAIQTSFKEHTYLGESVKLSASEKSKYKRHEEGQFSDAELSNSLHFLSSLLCKHHNKVFRSAEPEIKAYILVDEYDNPVNNFLSKSFTKNVRDRIKVSTLMTNIMSACGKGNVCAEKIIVTGVLDAFQKDARSGFNNFKISDTQFSRSFGFSQQEVDALIVRLRLSEARCAAVKENIKSWYNGYNVAVSAGEVIQVYTPWSVMNYLSDVTRDASGGVPVPQRYWSAGGASEILDNLSRLSLPKHLLDKLQDLADYKEVHLVMEDDFSLFGALKTRSVVSESTVTYLLLSNGYISKSGSSFVVPNNEVLNYFRKRVLPVWLEQEMKANNLGNRDTLLKELSTSLSDSEDFKKKVQELILNKIKGGDKTESYFQSLIGGLIEWYAINKGKGATHHVLSEKSVSTGRIDNVFYPITPDDSACAGGASAACAVKATVRSAVGRACADHAIIHEYKMLCSTKGTEPKNTLCEAMWQILKQCYVSEPLAKKEAHPLHTWSKIKLRSVVCTRDDSCGKWSVDIKEKELDVAQAKRIEQFFSYKLVKAQLEGTTEEDRNTKKAIFLKELLGSAARDGVFSLVDCLATESDKCLEKLRVKVLTGHKVNKDDVGKILDEISSAAMLSAKATALEIKKKFKASVPENTIGLLRDSFIKAAVMPAGDVPTSPRPYSVASVRGLVVKAAGKAATIVAASAPVEPIITVHRVPGEGNCLFHAVKHQLTLIGHKDRALSHIDLRQRAMDAIAAKTRCKSVISFAKGDLTKENYEDYITDMRKDGQWGGRPEILGVATYLQINIAVLYQSSADSEITLAELVFPIGSDAKAYKDVIFIIHTGGRHYDSVTRIDSKHDVIEEVIKLKSNYAFAGSCHARIDTAITVAASAVPSGVRSMVVDAPEPVVDHSADSVGDATAVVVKRFTTKKMAVPHDSLAGASTSSAPHTLKRLTPDTATVGERATPKRARTASATPVASSGGMAVDGMVVDVASKPGTTSTMSSANKFRLPRLQPPRGTLSLKQLGSFWHEYYAEGLQALLVLRLSKTATTPTNVVLIDETNATSINFDYSAWNKTRIVPIIYQAVDKPAHWVGLILNRAWQSSSIVYQATYIDSENNPIPQVIAIAFTQALPPGISLTFEQRFVVEQSYSNNCGSELIEHFAEAITGCRVPEGLVPAYHSELLASFLWVEAGHRVRDVFPHRSVTGRELVVYRSKMCDIASDAKVVEEVQCKAESSSATNPTLRLDHTLGEFSSFVNLVSQGHREATGELLLKAQELLNSVLDKPESTKQTVLTTILLDIVDALNTEAPMPFFPGWGGEPDDDPDGESGYGGYGSGGRKPDGGSDGFGAMFVASSDNAGFNATNTSVTGVVADDMNGAAW